MLPPAAAQFQKTLPMSEKQAAVIVLREKGVKVSVFDAILTAAKNIVPE